HRNITPDCAHLQPDGSVVLTDFDYARLPDRPSTGATVIGRGMNPEFAAPEVIEDPSKATKAADVYSIAKVGEKLFAAADGDGKTVDETPARWRTILETALATDPDTRPPDAGILLVRLDGHGPINPLFG